MLCRYCIRAAKTGAPFSVRLTAVENSSAQCEKLFKHPLCSTAKASLDDSRKDLHARVVHELTPSCQKQLKPVTESM